MRKVFLLGVGCQKGGTTWLYDYLAHHPNANMGFRKEYHIFDGLFVPECRVFLDDVKARAAAMLAEATFPVRGDSQIIRLLGFYTDPSQYFDYFRMLADRSDETVLVGDITPSYCALSKEVLAQIKQSLVQRGFQVRVIFLMRDPVDRCVSALRMEWRNARERGEAPVAMDEPAAILQVYSRPDYEMRTRYEMTILNLESVFAVNELLCEFYESFFCREAIMRMTSFLGIPYLEPDFSHRPNESWRGSSLDAAHRMPIYLHYRDTYDFVASRFGHAEVSALWPNHREFGA